MFLADFLPKSSEIDGNYVEPFLGGGSVFLYVKPERAVISDLNEELIDLYRGIRNYPNKVWKTFVDFPTGKDAFYCDDWSGKIGVLFRTSAVNWYQCTKQINIHSG